MNRFLRSGLLALLLAASASAPSAQPVTGLSGWSIYLDPGHSQNENVGVFGYSEARKTLRVALALRDLLQTQTDIDTVYMSRTNDSQLVSLSQRTTHANEVGADFYYSIHSDAGGPTANSTLMLYGGWRQNGQTVEKTPQGGARMGALLEDILTRAMRTGTRGTYADRTFYQGFPFEHENKWPYLAVNRQSYMPSLLSEAGFHTNPRQNQLNMNADWKRLEAQAAFWAILDYHGLERPPVSIATGTVTDVESGRPINGATVTVGGGTYTTDTYASLFNQYSTDPDELANGFYYLDGLSGGTLGVTVEAEGYRPYTGEVAMVDDFFSFHDAALISDVPPVVASTVPEAGADRFAYNAPLDLVFSRKMDPATTEAAFALAPVSGGGTVTGTFEWLDAGYRVVFRPVQPLEPEAGYTLTIAGTAEGVYGDPLDGDADGTGGDAFTLAFTTGALDVAAPRLTASYPKASGRDVELRPVVSVTFSEEVVPATLEGRVTLATGGGAAVAGQVQHVAIGGRSVVAFAPAADLVANTVYRFTIAPGVEDEAGNASTGPYAFSFTTGAESYAVTPIDDFEGGIGRWWLPQQSGSTVGIVTDSTGASASTVANPLGGATSMRIDYGWREEGPWLVRQCFNGCSPGAVRFDGAATLQAHVFGDGSGTLFRFAVDDAAGIEVSPWYTVDWYGWRPVTWDLDVDGAGSWIGNGAFDGALSFESLQLSTAPGAARFGQIWVDDLRLLQSTSVGTEGGGGAGEPLALLAARPNPFRDRTEVRFVLGAPAEVTVRVYNVLGQEVGVLASAVPLAAGDHGVVWDARGMASGVYVARVEAGAEVRTVQVVLTR